MRLEDDPCIRTVHCPVCSAAQGVPCNPPHDRFAVRDRKYIRSHKARIKAHINFLAQSENPQMRHHLYHNDDITVADFYLAVIDVDQHVKQIPALDRLIKRLKKRVGNLPS